MERICIFLLFLVSTLVCAVSAGQLQVEVAANTLSPTVLETRNIQTASQHDGLPNNNSIGFVPSATDPANFINYCDNKRLTNGNPMKGASCNGIVMNLLAGSQTNPESTFYAAPQGLKNGKIVGHPQIAIQSLDGHDDNNNQIVSTPAPDPTVFVFFRAITDTGDQNGVFAIPVDGGLPEGFYRICTMIVSSNHQPVIMPVIERGAQNDCQKFYVRNN